MHRLAHKDKPLELEREGMSDKFIFLPLGGVGEIGMNFAAYGFGTGAHRQWLIVDMGVGFANQTYPGADLVFPDISFLQQQKENICGILLTHAHEDHYGAVAFLAPLLKAPVYCTNFTAHLLETKFSSIEDFQSLKLKIFKAGDILDISPFTIEAISVSHSIPEAVSFAISTPLGAIIHTGDWRIDEAPVLLPKTDSKRFKEWGEKGVLALVCDSTNALTEENAVSTSEQAVAESLTQIIAGAQKRVVITSFSSNIGRIRSVIEAAEAVGRKVLLVGRSMKRCIAIAAECGYLGKKTERFLSEAEYASTKREEIVVIVTGSQGEERAALTKLSKNSMQNIILDAGDLVIFSSKNIPGNERAILDVQNRLIEQKIEVLTNEKALVHVSGHPTRSQLKQMYDWVMPRILIPVHGEAAHLSAHAQWGKDCGIETIICAKDGDMVELAPEAGRILEKVKVGRLFSDGRLFGTEQDLGINKRRKLSYVVHVSVCISVNKKRREAELFDLASYGLPSICADGRLLEDALFEAAQQTLENLPHAQQKDEAVLEKCVGRAIRAAAEKIWGKKPVVTIFIVPAP